MDNYLCYEGKDHHGGCSKPCTGCVSYGKDRRQGDRRRISVSLRLRERRKGFDRRKNPARKKSLYHRVFRRGAFHLNDNHGMLVLLLITFNILNVADFLFTLKALSAGFSEGNPIMDKMFAIGPFAAGIFKIGLTFFIAAIVWAFRTYRVILEISILFLLMYMLLIIYHIYGAIRFY